MNKEKLKEYFKFADSLGVLDADGSKEFNKEDLELINKKRDELFDEDWKYV